MIDIGQQVKSDNSYTAKCRLLQSVYRALILKRECGNGPNKSSEKQYGNFIKDGQINGANFINEYSFRYAKSKVLEKRVNPDLTIDEYRLFNNMLSSMPMAFNLFGIIRKYIEDNEEVASNIIKTVFPNIIWFKKIHYLDIEFIPRPIDEYTDDKSAFDVLIIGSDGNDKLGIITIETKYTDLLGKNSSKNNELKFKIIESEKIFTQEYQDYCRTNGFNQLLRNFLLTLSYFRKHNFSYFNHIILSPKFDKHSFDDVRELNNNLKKYQNNIQKIDLEDYINLALEVDSDDYKKQAQKFYERYLDFNLIKKVENEKSLS